MNCDHKLTCEVLSALDTNFQDATSANDDDEKIPESNASVIAQDIPDQSLASTSGTLLLEGHETSETKLLSNEQLQRLVLLKQLKVLTLQQQRLERLEKLVEVDGKEIDFEYIGWDKANNN